MKAPVWVLALLSAAVFAPAAFAHAHVSPHVALANAGQLFSLDVPTEKEGATTNKIVLTLPAGFSVDSVVPTPGWKLDVQRTGSGDSAVVQKLTWSGGSVPTDEVSHFAFLGLAQSAKTYAFSVEQFYSDGSVVNWSGPESSDTPAPTVEAKSSLGGGGSGTLAYIAIALGAVGVVLGGLALVSKSGRSLA
jgi:uncharacterized protein YcnI